MAPVDEYEYTVVRAPRRTMAVYIRPDGRVEVRAPRWVSAGRIQEFVESKGAWIARKREEVLERVREREVFRLEEGTPVSILGREYRVSLAAPGERAGLSGERLVLQGEDQGELRSCLEKVLRRLARGTGGEALPKVGIFPGGSLCHQCQNPVGKLFREKSSEFQLSSLLRCPGSGRLRNPPRIGPYPGT